MKTCRRQKTTQRGYTLISVMLLLTAMAVIAMIQFRDQAFKYDIQKALIAGKQMRALDDAVEGYIASHARYLRAMSDNECAGTLGCVVVAPPAGIYCAAVGSSGNQCELNYGQLVAEGYLPPQWKNKNVWGSPYKTVVTRVIKNTAPAVGNEMDYDLRAITVTQAPWIDSSGKVLLGLLGQAVRAGGNDLAMNSASPALAQGLVQRSYNAAMTGGTVTTWNASSAMNPYIGGLGANVVGQLVARAGFESSASASFPALVRRDGSTAMAGDLLMGRQRINNTQDVFLRAASPTGRPGSAVGGRNLAAVTPTWVFKFSWRVGADGTHITKPDCRAQSGGNKDTTFVPGSAPWTAVYDPSSATNKSYDNGEPRILVVNDTLKNMKALGYYKNPAASCAASLTNTSPPQSSSCTATDPYDAYDPAFRARARAAYQFYAEDGVTYWNVRMVYHQDDFAAGAVSPQDGGNRDPADSQGIASVYCYYDKKAESACNGDVGCVSHGVVPAAPIAVADLSAPPAATTTVPYEAMAVAGATPTPAASGGAADVTCVSPQVVSPSGLCV